MKRINIRASLAIVFTSAVLFTGQAQAASPIVSFAQSHELLPAVEGVPNVTIFDDGTVEVFRPSFMRAPGTFTTKLNEQQLSDLIKTVNLALDTDISNEKIQSDIDQVNTSQSDGVLFEVSDSTLVSITLTPNTVDGQVSADSSSKTSGRPVEVDVENLPQLAQQYPRIASITVLHALAEQLRGVFELPAADSNP